MSKKKRDEWWKAYEEMRVVEEIIQRIMGWECFGSWEAYLHKYGAQEWKLGEGKTYTTPTPVAFYVDYMQEWRVFSPDHKELETFDPLHNLNDAWLIMDHLKPGRADKNAQEGDTAFTVRARFVSQLDSMDRWWSWTKEQMCSAICDAAIWAIEPEGQKGQPQ